MGSDHSATVVLCWHMHQPGYQDLRTGEFLAPWVYLHAIKDYSDMAGHLEAHPGAKAVVNFAPVLLEQIETYLAQIDGWQQGTCSISDPLLKALVTTELPAPGTQAFLDLVETCLRANQGRIIQRFSAYAKLAGMAEDYRSRPEIQIYISEQFLVDLVVWYHLGWIGEIVRRNDSHVLSLQEKAHGFSLDDRQVLLQLIFDILAGIGPRYRRLAERGQIELALSPYAHPILPLLIDLTCAREARPGIVLPEPPTYPGGEDRARWQLEWGLVVFKRFFNIQPTGCWASEGGLSQPTLALLAEQGFHWTASGDTVLANSVHQADAESSNGGGGEAAARPHTLYRFGETDISVFFRDDGLSDLIGFTYADWHAKDAVGDLVHHMENIANHSPASEPCIIPIIMDGENAWEYFPENGFNFLDELYRQLEQHPFLQLSTFNEVVHQHRHAARYLPRLVAGSWIDGTFTTWVGDPDKNRAWEWLCEAKRHFDSANLPEERKVAALRQLALCEGSDWCWWFGDYNPPQIVRDFEHLYRRHLVNLYALIGQPVPSHVLQQLSQGGGSPARGGAMRPGHLPGDGP